jgi:hypothetical protein
MKVEIGLTNDYNQMMVLLFTETELSSFKSMKKKRQLIITDFMSYCDMSTHCWVVQLVSRHRPVNKVSAQTR